MVDAANEESDAPDLFCGPVFIVGYTIQFARIASRKIRNNLLSMNPGCVTFFPDMVATLKNLLVSEIAEDGLPLFSNSVKLAEAVAAVSPTAYRNPKTTAALLNFVFRCERNCSDSLREALIKAVRARLAKQPKRIQDDWVQRVARAADTLSSEVAKAQQTRAVSDEEQFDRLLERAESAEKHFIVTPLTAEQEDGVERADKLNLALLRHLGLAPRNTASPLTEYWFLLPNAETGAQFWRELEEKAKASSGDAAWVQERLAFLDDRDFIQVYIVPSFVCGCPLVVYDPDKSRDATAFSFSHHPANVIDTIQWDHKSVEQWQTNVFKAFVPVKSETAAKEVMKNNPSKFPGYRCPVPAKTSK